MICTYILLRGSKFFGNFYETNNFNHILIRVPIVLQYNFYQGYIDNHILTGDLLLLFCHFYGVYVVTHINQVVRSLKIYADLYLYSYINTGT
jgi:hypothetical protein